MGLDVALQASASFCLGQMTIFLTTGANHHRQLHGHPFYPSRHWQQDTCAPQLGLQRSKAKEEGIQPRNLQPV